jgi:hypothetical protein
MFAVPFEDEIRKTVACNDDLESTVTIQIGDRYTVVQLNGVIEDQAAAINEHACHPR